MLHLFCPENNTKICVYVILPSNHFSSNCLDRCIIICSSQFDTKLKTFGLVFSSSSSFVEIGCWRNLNLNFFYFLTGQIRDLINQYLIEANSGQYDYVKALAEFSSKDESALTFKKGEIIAVVPKHDAYTEKVSTLKP